MLTEYIRAAMAKATYEILEDGTYYGEIAECQGVWIDKPTLEQCREELREVLEDWIVLGVQFGDSLPVIDGIELKVRLVA